MLRSLTIRDFVIVDHLELDFATGFTALTGETGAGKSILIDALSLALGGRADSAVVRAGQARAEIAAIFHLANLQPARDWLAANDLADEDENTCLFRRIIDSSGRSKAYINGASVTLMQMRELAEWLIDIHGQHEHQRLLKREVQLALLDEFADNDALLNDVRALYQQWSKLATSLAARRANEADVARETEELNWQIDELERLHYSPARWDDIQTEQRRLANAAELIRSAEGTVHGLAEAEGAILPSLDSLVAELGVAADTDSALAEALALMNSANLELKEATASLRQYLRRLELDPERLAELDRQIADVLDCARKYRIEPMRIPEILQQKRDRLAALGGGQSLEALESAEAAARAAYQVAAKKLTKARQQGAKKFAAEVSQSLQQLAMPGGRFSVEFIPCEPTAHGMEGCEFQVSAHEGQPAGPLAKIASGGELSRISLAIQMMASKQGGVGTMIFDEVDSGIGGRVAEVVGRLLHALGAKSGGQQGQVLAVTHLPQVAASADHQFRVVKVAKNGVAATAIDPLDRAARVEEIARMLGGITITAATRQTAEEMLNARMDSSLNRVA